MVRFRRTLAWLQLFEQFVFRACAAWTHRAWAPAKRFQEEAADIGAILAIVPRVRPPSSAAVLSLVVSLGTGTAAAEVGSLPRFKARALSGAHKTEQDLLGQPAVLVVTPNRSAARECKSWGEVLQETLPSRVVLRAILALDIPFFIPDEIAVHKAQEKVPPRLWDRTWLLTSGSLEKKLGIPSDATEPFVFAFDPEGRILARACGAVTSDKVRRLTEALVGDARHRSAAR